MFLYENVICFIQKKGKQEDSFNIQKNEIWK